MDVADIDESITIIQEDNKKLNISYETQEEYQGIIYALGEFIGLELFLEELMSLLEKNKAPKEVGELILQELSIGPMISYISGNFFKLLKSYLRDEEALNVDAFKKFRVKGLDEEVAIFVSLAESQFKFQGYLDKVETASIDELRNEFEEGIASGADISLLLPIITQIYNKLEDKNVQDVHLVKKEGISLLVNDKGTILNVENLLSFIHPGIIFEAIAGESLAKYIDDIALFVHIVRPKRIVIHSESFAKNEIVQVESVVKKLKHDLPHLEIYEGGK